MKRVHVFLLLGLLAGLSACGFQLRQAVALSPALQTMRVNVMDDFSHLNQDLPNALHANQVMLTDAKDAPVLTVWPCTESRRNMSVTTAGRVGEVSLTSTCQMDVASADATQVLLPKQAIVVTRVYAFDPNQAQGAPAEEAVVREEMQRAMVDAMMRRLEAVGE